MVVSQAVTGAVASTTAPFGGVAAPATAVVASAIAATVRPASQKPATVTITRKVM